jgi:hypothetical protein
VWRPQIDTSFDDGTPELPELAPGAEYPLRGRSLALLCRAR